MDNILQILKRDDREELLRFIDQNPKFSYLGFDLTELCRLHGANDCLESLGVTVPKGKEVPYLTWPKLGKEFPLKQVIASCPYLLRWTPIGKRCRQFAQTWKGHLSSAKVIPLEIRKVSDHIGMGAFTKQPLKKGDWIGEYTGVIRPLKNWNQYCLHYPTRFWSHSPLMIDAAEAGNETRYINHSDDPNLQAECLLDRGLLHFVFFANQNIPTGKELTVDYGPDYWRLRKKQ